MSALINANPNDDDQSTSQEVQLSQSSNPLAHILLKNSDGSIISTFSETLSDSDALVHIKLKDVDKITTHAVRMAREKDYADIVRQQEKTHADLLSWLVKLFSLSLAASFIMAGIAIINPEVDKNFIKDVLPILIAPQVTLLGGVYGAFCLRSRSSKEKN